MEGRAQTSLNAFLFTDIVGSTDLKRRLGDVEGAKVIAAHDACFREAVAEFEGHEQNNPGDGFFATFPVPSAALNCALTFQAGITDLPLDVRVGIHMGEAVHVPGAGDDEKLLGLAVDTAGRVMSLALANQILITRHAFDSARQQVMSGPADARIVWCAHGAYLFKGLGEALEIHEAGIEGVAPLTPPADSGKAKRAIAPGDEETLGWRPGVGLGIPGREGWTLERELGVGGFGEVWLAKSNRTKEQRAFKFCFRADRLRTLKRELTLFRLIKETLGEREDIARLYDVRFDKAPYFLEMEYTPDGSLDRWAEQDDRLARMTMEQRAEFVAEIAEALSAAHSVGVLHKDVKPSNILVRKAADGSAHARLTDFGIGQLLDTADLDGAMVSATGFTETGILTDLGSRTGTRLYMAPELIVGKPANIASDLFALGVVLYQTIIGDLRRPLSQGWEQEIDDPLLVEDIAACIAGNPAERVASGSVIAERLRSLDARREAQAAEKRRIATESRRARRARIATVAAAILLVVAISGFVVAGMLEQRRRETEQARNEAAAERDEKSAALAQVLRLADAKVVRDLIGEVDELWPVGPDRAPVMKTWIERAEAVLASRGAHESELASLRARAEPYSETQRQADHAKTLRSIPVLRDMIEKSELPPERLVRARSKLAEYEAEVAKRRTWKFALAADDWRHDVLAGLVRDLQELSTLLPGIVSRHKRASTLAERTLQAGSRSGYGVDWNKTIEAIAASQKYGGLHLGGAQLGMIPLGPDPDSGLFEFALLESGSVPARDPATGRLQLTDDFAIVFVLIPASRFRMGAQSADANAPNYDATCSTMDSPVHEVILSPHFVSKFECTQFQWKRLTGEEPSTLAAYPEQPLTPRSPVEGVSHATCVKWLARHDLVLPTEAWWEHACRAGTDTPWSTGRDPASLQGTANIADATAKAAKQLPDGIPYTTSVDDGHLIYAPVGSFAANAFGFHDMHGNIREWCRDAWKDYPAETVTDPYRKDGKLVVVRGGSFAEHAEAGAAAHRMARNPTLEDATVGVRPARFLKD